MGGSLFGRTLFRMRWLGLGHGKLTYPRLFEIPTVVNGSNYRTVDAVSLPFLTPIDFCEGVQRFVVESAMAYEYTNYGKFFGQHLTNSNPREQCG